jgi:hypothetical protein
MLGALAGVFGTRLVTRTARRDHVWKRVEWALSMVLSEEPRAQELGYVALAEIIDGGLADKRDVAVIVALANVALASVEEQLEGGDDFTIDGEDEDPPAEPMGEP